MGIIDKAKNGGRRGRFNAAGEVTGFTQIGDLPAIELRITNRGKRHGETIKVALDPERGASENPEKRPPLTVENVLGHWEVIPADIADAANNAGGDPKKLPEWLREHKGFRAKIIGMITDGETVNPSMVYLENLVPVEGAENAYTARWMNKLGENVVQAAEGVSVLTYPSVRFSAEGEKEDIVAGRMVYPGKSKSGSATNTESLIAFVGDAIGDYVEDENVTSVGVFLVDDSGMAYFSVPLGRVDGEGEDRKFRRYTLEELRDQVIPERVQGEKNFATIIDVNGDDADISLRGRSFRLDDNAFGANGAKVFLVPTSPIQVSRYGTIATGYSVTNNVWLTEIVGTDGHVRHRLEGRAAQIAGIRGTVPAGVYMGRLENQCSYYSSNESRESSSSGGVTAGASSGPKDDEDFPAFDDDEGPKM